MADFFEAIAQTVIDRLNGQQAPAASPAQPDGRVTVAVREAPAQDAPSPSEEVSAKPGIWTLATMTAEIIRNEGGYVDDPSDSGGATKYGISLAFAKTHPDFFDLDHDGKVDAADIQRLSPSLASEAFIRYFFMPAHFNRLPNTANIVMQLYDMAVNMGVRYRDGESEAVKILQHAVQTVVDGLLGPGTLAAVDSALSVLGSAELNNRIVDARKHFYDQVVAAHPEDGKFLDGWKRRAEQYRV